MLYPVELIEVPRVWEVVSPYLKQTFDRSPIPISLEGVYKEIIDGKLKLFLMTDNGKLWGAVLFQVYTQVGVKVLNVFAMSHKPGYKKLEDDMEQAEELAKLLRCEYLIGYCRKGFTKTLVPFGFEYAQAVMARKVGE